MENWYHTAQNQRRLTHIHIVRLSALSTLQGENRTFYWAIVGSSRDCTPLLGARVQQPHTALHFWLGLSGVCAIFVHHLLGGGLVVGESDLFFSRHKAGGGVTAKRPSRSRALEKRRISPGRALIWLLQNSRVAAADEQNKFSAYCGRKF
jgi:hypothetical protein